MEKTTKEMIIEDLVPLLSKEEINQYLKIGLRNAYTSNSLYEFLRTKQKEK